MLELASEISKGQSYEEALHLVEPLRYLLKEILDDLLSHCRHKKIVRLVHTLADEAEHAWAEDVRQHLDRINSTPPFNETL